LASAFGSAFLALKEFIMKRYVALSLLALVFAVAPCQAQFLKKIEQEVMGGQGQGQGQG